MKIDIKDYVRFNLELLCKDMGLSEDKIKKITIDEFESILYVVENRVDDLIYEMFSEVVDDIQHLNNAVKL